MWQFNREITIQVNLNKCQCGVLYGKSKIMLCCYMYNDIIINLALACHCNLNYLPKT